MKEGYSFSLVANEMKSYSWQDFVEFVTNAKYMFGKHSFSAILIKESEFSPSSLLHVKVLLPL